MMQPTLFKVKDSRRRSAAGTAKPGQYDKLSDIDKQRYMWHKQLPDDYLVDAMNWTIEVPYRSFEEVPIGPRYYVQKLKDMGYTIQYAMFPPDTMRAMVNKK